MNASDVISGCEALIPVEKRDSFPRVVAGRAALQIPFLRPGAQCKNVDNPLFVAVCTTDTVAPPGPTRAYAKQAPRGVVKDYKVRKGARCWLMRGLPTFSGAQCGHFDIYLGELFEEASKDYVAFLQKHLPVN